MDKGQKTTVALLIAGAFLSVLNTTLINPALPSIMQETGVNETTVQWLVSGFTLVNAIVIAISAFLMDRFSTKKLFLAIFALFFAGSLLAAWGVNFPVLLAGRIMQAICAGVLLPMSITILLLVFPRDKRGSAMGIYNLVIMFAPAIGPVISGVLTDKIGWHIMFLTGAIFAAVIILIGAVFMKSFGETKRVSLDKPSVLLSSFGLFCMLYGFSIFGQTLIPAIVLIAAGSLMVALFARRQLKSEQPFLQIRVLGNKQFRSGAMIQMLIQASLATAIAMPIYIQTVRGMPATISGMVVMPGALIGAATGYFAGKLYDRFEARPLAIAGVLMVASGSVGISLFDLGTPIPLMMVCCAIQFAGLMLANTPINLWAISDLSDDLLHHGNAVTSTLRQVAATVSTAIIVSVMTLVTSMSGGSGAAQAKMSGISAAFWLSVAIASIALVLVIVKVRGVKIDAVDAGMFELDGVMKGEPYTALRADTLRQVVEKFIEYRTSGLPIIDAGGHVIGFISDGDILRYLARRDIHLDFNAYSAVLPDTEDILSKVKSLFDENVMRIASKRVISVNRNMPLNEVCRLFFDRNLNKIPVTENDVIVGTVSRGDIMRLILNRLSAGAAKM
jgi:EmrB/QacA subfamily drug resistance transporter